MIWYGMVYCRETVGNEKSPMSSTGDRLRHTHPLPIESLIELQLFPFFLPSFLQCPRAYSSKNGEYLTAVVSQRTSVSYNHYHKSLAFHKKKTE